MKTITKTDLSTLYRLADYHYTKAIELGEFPTEAAKHREFRITLLEVIELVKEEGQWVKD